jgi:NADPH2 dehydrogenase
MKTRAIRTLKTIDHFRAYIAELGIDLQCDDRILTGDESPLTGSFEVHGRTIGNRWTAHPMEGWDGTADGHTTEPMIRRWKHFGLSGAKLIWGGEAMAVRADGRANPHQLMILPETEGEIAALRQTTLDAHRESFGTTDDMLIGFQLTHSGRFCKPGEHFEPRVAYRHPLLDVRFGGLRDDQVFTDEEFRDLIPYYVNAAKIAANAGADFVDVKCCHGYLLHECLGAITRPGPYGGSFENRTRLFREIVEAIRSDVPGMLIGVRFSGFDMCPYYPDPALTVGNKLGPGIKVDYPVPYNYGFAIDRDDPTTVNLTETEAFLELLQSMDIRLVNVTAGSPYYNPHIQRPALRPPSDGYAPPEDPIVGCARQINAVKEMKAKFPEMVFVGTAYTYLQEYLPQVAQHYLREGHVDSVGIGRMLLPYPQMLADATTKGELNSRMMCRTISDCTTAPRKGLPSGCYPLDDYYKKSDDGAKLTEIKKAK